MKKLVFAAFFCAIATLAPAQFILGGQFTFGIYNDKDKFDVGDDREEKTTVVTLIPRIASEVNENVWVGADLGVSLVSQTNNFSGNDNTFKTTLFTVGPFARYIWKPADKMGVWVEGQANANFGNSKAEDEKTAEYFGFGVGIRPGVIFFIGDRISFEASVGRLGFSSFTNTDPDNDEEKNIVNQFGLTLNNNLGGLSYLIGDPFSLGGIMFGVNCRL